MKKIQILFTALFFLVEPVFLTGCSTTQSTIDKQIDTSNNQQEFVVTVDEGGVKNFNNKQLKLELSELDQDNLTEKGKEGLIFMREEEKLAHDVYSVLFDKWGQKSFNNISSSEQTHTDAVKSLLNKYSIDDPSANTKLGEFMNKDLQALYDQLLKQGEVSLVEALKVGAIVEEVDIVDLQKYLEEVDNEDIVLVYENLMRGSRNHLRAYVKNLDKQEVTYSPEYLSEEEYEEIIGSETERGNGRFGRGR